MNENLLKQELNLFMDWLMEKSKSVDGSDIEAVDEYLIERTKFAERQKKVWKYLYQDIIP